MTKEYFLHMADGPHEYAHEYHRAVVKGREDELMALSLLLAEYGWATSKFGRYASMHEGYAVVLEEVDEAWDEVKANNPDLAIKEMVQVATTALRFVVDISRKHDIPLEELFRG